MLLFVTMAAEGGGGFDPLDLAGFGNFFWTLLIFLVALPFIWKVVMGPVTAASPVSSTSPRSSTPTAAVPATESPATRTMQSSTSPAWPMSPT